MFWLKADSENRLKQHLAVLKGLLNERQVFAKKLVNGWLRLYILQGKDWKSCQRGERMLATAKVSTVEYCLELSVFSLVCFLNRGSRDVHKWQVGILENAGGEWAGRWSTGKSFPWLGMGETE